jgi:hypothetical protein
MSCWVVPTIAAEIWGVSVDSILQRVRDGDLAHRVDEGFMFVDVEPVKVVPPPTFTILSAAEVEALRATEVEQFIEPAPEPAPAPAPEATIDEEESQSPDDDEASVDLGDWRAARRRTGMKRIPPPKSRAAAA